MDPRPHDPHHGRYSKASKQLLLDYLNYVNNRRFTLQQLDFGKPEPVDTLGLTRVEVIPISGFTESHRTAVTYERVTLEKVFHCSDITVYSSRLDLKSLLAAIKEQYHVFLEEPFFTLEADPTSLVSVVHDQFLNGFVVNGQLPLPAFDDDTAHNYSEAIGDFILTTKADHLLFTGQLRILVRPAIRLLGDTIASRLSLREFYKDHRDQFKVPIELALKDNPSKVVRQLFKQTPEYRTWIEKLIAMKQDYLFGEGHEIAELASLLTGDCWQTCEAPAAFNLYGAEVIYNGTNTGDYYSGDPKYNKVLVLKLGDQCTNLSGYWKINYIDPRARTSMLDPAAVPPIFV